MIRRPFGLVLAALLFASVTGCGGGSTDRELVVYAASSLTEAFQKVGAAFEAEVPNVRVVFNFAGSSTLRTQLEAGARADVFASADEQQMELAVEAGLVDGGPFRLAENRLTVAASTLSTSVESLTDLAEPGVKVILALPQVPVGAYARQALTRMDTAGSYGPDFLARVLANVVSEETNVREVLAKVSLGEADAGIVYATDVAARSDDRLRTVSIPDEVNVTAIYPVALLREGERSELGSVFIAYLLSPEGQAILSAHGFNPAAGAGG